MEKDRVIFLQEMPIFGGLGKDALELLVDGSNSSTFEKGEYLVRQDAPPGEVYILEDGKADVIKVLEDREYELCKLGRGDCIGEMALIDPHPRSAHVVASTRASAIRLEPKHFYHLRKKDLAQFTVLQLNIARELCRRLRAVESRLFLMLAEKGCNFTV